MPLRKGDVVKGTLREFDEAFHFIVYLEESGTNAFMGVVLTRSGDWSNNIPLPAHYIQTQDESGATFAFQHDNTHFMCVTLDKPVSWGPYTKIGQITPDGVTFIESHLSGMTSMTYAEYARNAGIRTSKRRRRRIVR